MVLAFTDWGVLAYVLTGLVFAALVLASAITQQAPPGNPPLTGGAREAPLPCSTTTPEASRKLAARTRPTSAMCTRSRSGGARQGPSAGSLPAGSPSTRSTPEPGIQGGDREQPAQRARARR